MAKNVKLNHSGDQSLPTDNRIGEEEKKEEFLPNHSHAWRGTWNRPMMIDENLQHPLTIARMTDHNVRGVNGKPDERSILNSSREGIESKEKKAA